MNPEESALGSTMQLRLKAPEPGPVKLERRHDGLSVRTDVYRRGRHVHQIRQHPKHPANDYGEFFLCAGLPCATSVRLRVRSSKRKMNAHDNAHDNGAV